VVDREFSAGGVVTDSEGQVAIIATRNLKGERVWGLPKGHPRPGESLLEAAVREVEEETGLEVRPLSSEPAARIEYWYVRAGRRIHKQVAYFRMTATGGDGSGHDSEVEQVVLLPFSEARERLTYQNERRLLEEVLCASA
jgi:8-oxo-dGTP pyrophosphatase MutT (NUDIX family)